VEANLLKGRSARSSETAVLCMKLGSTDCAANYLAHYSHYLAISSSH